MHVLDGGARVVPGQLKSWKQKERSDCALLLDARDDPNQDLASNEVVSYYDGQQDDQYVS